MKVLKKVPGFFSWYGGGYAQGKIVVMGDSWGFFYGSPAVYDSFVSTGAYYSELVASNTNAPEYPSLPGRTLPAMVTNVGSIIAAMSGVDSAVLVIGTNSIATRTFDQMRADYVTVLDAMDAAGYRILVTSSQPGAPGNVPMTAPVLAIWQQLQAWMEAYADGMGYDFIPWDDFSNYATGGILDGYCEATKDETSALHMNTAGYNLFVGKVNAKLQQAPIDNTTAARQAIRNMPNRELLTVTDINNTMTLLDNISVAVQAKLTDIWYFSSDITASGNAATGLINATTGTFNGSPSVVGDEVYMDATAGTPQYFDTGVAGADIQGIVGKPRVANTVFTSHMGIMGASTGGSNATGIRCKNTNSVDVTCESSFDQTTTPLESLATDYHKVLHYSYEAVNSNFVANIRSQLYVDGIKRTMAGTNLWTGNVTDTLCFNVTKGRTSYNLFKAYWQVGAITNGLLTDAEAAELAAAINSI